MHAAASQAHSGAIKVLGRHGADVNIADDTGCTPFDLVMGKPRPQAVLALDALFAAGLEINRATHSPLFQALDHDELMECLLVHGLDPNVQQNGETVLFRAAVSGSSKSVIESLLKYGADATMQCGPRRLTALDVATAKNHQHVIRVLKVPLRVLCTLPL